MILTPFDLLESRQREELLILHREWACRGGYHTYEYYFRSGPPLSLRKDEDTIALASFLLDKATILGWYIAGINPFA